MTRARGIFGLGLLVGIAGAAATVLALAVVADSVTFHGADLQMLLHACQTFALPRVTVASLLVMALGSVAFASLGLGIRSAVRQAVASRRFLATLKPLHPSPVGPLNTLVFSSDQPQAFCAGLLHPRIYLSDATLRLLDTRELDAVIAHETHHARYRDPLRICFARVLADALFFLPVLRRLSQRYEALAELAADAAAVRSSHNDAAPLASALLAFDGAASPAVVGIAPERVDHLLGERTPWELPVALLTWAVVVVGAIVIVAIRVAQAGGHTVVDLPMLTSQLCMVAMAVIPLMLGAAALLGSSRLLGLRRRG